MYSAIHSLLLIIALLVCPVRCMAGTLLLDDAPEAAAATGCSCHHCRAFRSAEPEEESPDGEHQERPSDSCECGSCLCQGALKSGEDVLLDFRPTLQSLAEVALPALLFGEQDRSLQHFAWLSEPHGPPASGATLCAWHQRWLL